MIYNTRKIKKFGATRMLCIEETKNEMERVKSRKRKMSVAGVYL
jgi:hypothetical protein